MVSSNYYVQDNSDLENKKLEAASVLYKQGNFSGALNIYLGMVNTSFSYKLYYEIGRCYYKLNDFEKAEEFFKQSIALEDKRNPSYTFLGNVFSKREDVNTAIEYWAKAFSFRPDDESVCLNLATSYFSKNMKFQSLYYYEKYLKYAKDKASNYYLEIKKSIDGFKDLGLDFYQKAQKAISLHDNETAIQSLSYAVKNYPLSFDANYLLGKLYGEEKNYMQALVYLKQGFCVDRKSLDILQLLSTIMLNLSDYTGAYCALKRMLPLVLNNQREYLEITKLIKQLESGFDKMSAQGHLDWADNYYRDNNYQLALLEYENATIINSELIDELDLKIQLLKSYIYPEERIIKSCLERGGAMYSNGDFKKSNKYFTKIMTLSNENTYEYKLAKSRIRNV